MHVIIQPVNTGVIIATTYSKKLGFRIRSNDPRFGWWKVVWKRKQRGVKEISGALSKGDAERMAAILNAIPKKQALSLVTQLHSKGGNVIRDHQLNNPSYSGRSFARNG